MRRATLLLVLLLVGVLPASASAPRVRAAQDLDPVWSPDGTEIAFTRIASNVFTLEVYDARAHLVRKVATNTFQLLPSWSGGDDLAYEAFGSVWTVGADGTGLARVARSAFAPAWRPATSDVAYVTMGGELRLAGAVWAQHVIGRPAWSPDGTRIAFERSDGIYVASAPRVERKVAAPAGEPGPPVWSHDGTRIAYAAQGQIWVVPADGSAVPRAVSARYDGVGTPSWSRQDDSLAYMRVGGLELTVLNGRSDLLVPILVGSGGIASFSPTSDLIAFSGPKPGCPGHRAIRIYVDNAHSEPVTGTCEVVGTAGADVIEGTAREGDVILAGAGNDQVHANDGHTDRVDCGPGYDTVWADRTDRLTGCERIHR